jgi:hypothetical protein
MGAIVRRPTDTAFAYRDAKYGMVFLASWTDPSKDTERIQWVREYYQALTPSYTGSSNLSGVR